MFDFILTVIAFWFGIACLALMMVVFNNYVLSPVCDFVANSPFVKYFILPVLVMLAMLSLVLVYYRMRPEKKLPHWIQKAYDKSPDLQEFLKR